MPFFSGRCHSRVRLDGMTAIVTGCNTGIGKETVRDFYKRGMKKLRGSLITQCCSLILLNSINIRFLMKL